MQETLKSIISHIEEIEFRINLAKGAIVGEPWVIECCPGLYLVSDGELYRGGAITGRTVCYSPDRIDAAVQHVRDNSGGVFDGARKVLRIEALRTELSSMQAIKATIEQRLKEAAQA